MLAIPTLPSAKLFSLKKEKLAQIRNKTENKKKKRTLTIFRDWHNVRLKYSSF